MVYGVENDEKCNKISLSSGRKFFIKLSTICANIECLPKPGGDKDLRKRLSAMIYEWVVEEQEEEEWEIKKVGKSRKG